MVDLTENTWALIVNPQAGKNRKNKQFERLAASLKAKDIPFHLVFTEYAGHLQPLLKDLITKGFRQFIVSGGDGTFGETANALYQQKIIDPLALTFAFSPAGTGNDWARTMQIPSNIRKRVDLIDVGYTIQQDLAKITCLDGKKNPITHYFMNVAGMGFDTFIAKNYLSDNKNMGGLTYYLQTAKGLLKYDNHFFTVAYLHPEKGWQKIEGKMFEVAFGLCQYFGGGMKITPNASPTSGLIDLTIIKDVTTAEGFSQLPKMVTGSFINFHKVETSVATKLKLSAPIEEQIQADGELIGYLPAEIEIVPKAMNVVVSDKLLF